jgi:hypothetical protein
MGSLNQRVPDIASDTILLCLRTSQCDSMHCPNMYVKCPANATQCIARTCIVRANETTESSVLSCEKYQRHTHQQLLLLLRHTLPYTPPTHPTPLTHTHSLTHTHTHTHTYARIHTYTHTHTHTHSHTHTVTHTDAPSDQPTRYTAIASKISKHNNNTTQIMLCARNASSPTSNTLPSPAMRTELLIHSTRTPITKNTR